MSDALLIENVEVDGTPGCSIHVVGGKIAAIGRGIRGRGQCFDGGGGAVIAGLIDHHVHLLATAAKDNSVDLTKARNREDLARLLAPECEARAVGEWVRAAGFHEHGGPLPDREVLDEIAPCHPLRIQHQTGGLWLLNSCALERISGAGPLPPGAERDEAGRATGRFWREDEWLRSRIGNAPISLDRLGSTLARLGITGVTDASVTNDLQSAALLAEARDSGALPQRLMLMSGGHLPPHPHYHVGPVKILLDDIQLPDFDAMIAHIHHARAQRRAVAIHCATAVQSAFAIAALSEAGAVQGDRIEHGSVLPFDMLPAIAAMRLTVVTQPVFCHDRGDRYLAHVDADDRGDLYRCASLDAAGIALAAGSDAPYGTLDPWASMRAAVMRKTALGQPLGLSEQVSPARALSLYQGSFTQPATPRRIAVGEPADLCVLQCGRAEALELLDAEMVRATLVAGQLIYDRDVR